MTDKSGRGGRKRGGQGTPPPDSAVTADTAAGSVAPEGSAAEVRPGVRRVRTPPPSPVAGGQPARQTRRNRGTQPTAPEARSAPLHSSEKAVAVNSAGGRTRTPFPGLEEQPREVRPLRTATAGLVTEPLQQVRFLQDFFRNPVPINLALQPVETSTPPEEIAGRISEIKYQLKVLASLQTVLNEEMQELERALPGAGDGASQAEA